MFWALLFEHFRAAQLALGHVFFATLGRRNLFWELLFEHFRAAQAVLGAGF